MYISVIICGNIFYALLDTGSAITLMSTQTFVNLKHSRELQKSESITCTVSGQPMQIDGQFYASTTIGTHKCNIRYIVSPDIQESIIIGTDLLQPSKK